MIEQETPKYKKKKESSVSKSKIKSKHKHDYSCECLVKEKAPYLAAYGKEPWHYARVIYCSICGKIYNYCYWVNCSVYYCCNCLYFFFKSFKNSYR